MKKRVPVHHHKKTRNPRSAFIIFFTSLFVLLLLTYLVRAVQQPQTLNVSAQPLPSQVQ